MINIHEYRRRVRRFIEKGDISEEQWEEITYAILDASEAEGYRHGVKELDRDILSPKDFVLIYEDEDDVY